MSFILSLCFSMPKLKVPSVAKPAKKQLTLFQLKRRPLHPSSREKTPELVEKPLQVSRVPPGISPKKQNGLRPAPKGFSDSFGNSDDEVSTKTSNLPLQ